jgi:hypothetical protein
MITRTPYTQLFKKVPICLFFSIFSIISKIKGVLTL